jgi:hypothetical protein
MLYAFGFDRIGVVLGDLYFVDPNPNKGQEGAERGVRLEVRMFERGELKGTIYSAQPIEIGRPIWRVDLLESVAGPPGSFDRTHHHPQFHEWDPSSRVFVEELSSRPLEWLADNLSNLEGVLKESGVLADDGIAEAIAADSADLRACVPEIVDAAGRLLARIRAGELGKPPAAEPVTSARSGWL